MKTNFPVLLLSSYQIKNNERNEVVFYLCSTNTYSNTIQTLLNYNSHHSVDVPY